jgi:hypothetical protein
MWEKWDSDDQDAGYDQENFKDNLKEMHEDSLREDVYDSGEARERAEERYPFSEYLSNHSVSDILETRRGRRSAHADNYREWLIDEKNWEDDNPDHDSKME